MVLVQRTWSQGSRAWDGFWGTTLYSVPLWRGGPSHALDFSCEVIFVSQQLTLCPASSGCGTASAQRPHPIAWCARCRHANRLVCRRTCTEVVHLKRSCPLRCRSWLSPGRLMRYRCQRTDARASSLTSAPTARLARAGWSARGFGPPTSPVFCFVLWPVTSLGFGIWCYLRNACNIIGFVAAILLMYFNTKFVLAMIVITAAEQYSNSKFVLTRMVITAAEQPLRG